MVTHLPKRRSDPEGTGGSLPAAGAPEKAKPEGDGHPSERSGGSLPVAGGPDDDADESGGAWTLVTSQSAKRAKAATEAKPKEAPVQSKAAEIKYTDA